MCFKECDIRNLLSNLCKDSVIFNDHDIKETCPPGSLIRTLTAVGSVDSGSSGISFTRSIFCCWINATLKSENVKQGVFSNWAYPEFAKCRPVSNRFQKNDRVPDWPPP